MKFVIDKKIFEKWPEVIIDGLILKNIDNSGSNEQLTNLLRGQESKTQKDLRTVELGQLPEIAIWRKIHREFGSDPRDFPSSIEPLLRRVRGGKLLPTINKLVDMYNYLSIKYRVPAGAEDIDKIMGDVRLTFADGSENGKYIGSDTVENCFAGEVIYKDGEGFICRRWNWREADRTKIDKNTKNALMVFEAAPPINIDKLNNLLSEAIKLSSEYLGGEQTQFILSEKTLAFKLGT